MDCFSFDTGTSTQKRKVACVSTRNAKRQKSESSSTIAAATTAPAYTAHVHVRWRWREILPNDTLHDFTEWFTRTESLVPRNGDCSSLPISIDNMLFMSDCRVDFLPVITNNTSAAATAHTCDCGCHQYCQVPIPDQKKLDIISQPHLAQIQAFLAGILLGPLADIILEYISNLDIWMAIAVGVEGGQRTIPNRGV